MEDNFESIRSSIAEKLGEDNMGLIADDMGLLIANHTSFVDGINSRDNEIKTLKDTNQRLVQANGKLLTQIPVTTSSNSHQKEEDNNKPFSFKSAFDEKGNFIK